jgi:Rubrerythrin
LAERWRKPLVPLLIEPLPEGIWLPDGRVQGQVSFTLLSTDIDRLRSGYACAKCLEVFEQAWPERCPLCGAPGPLRAGRVLRA